MKNRITLLLTSLSSGIFLLALATQVAFAHHSFSQFDRDVQRVVSGEVTKWAFNNPHVWIHIDAIEDDGSTKAWSFEGAGLVPLLKKGIDGNTYKPGDQVQIMYCPLVDGRAGGAIGWIMKEGDSMISPNDGGCWVTDEQKTQWTEWLEKGFTSNIEAEAA